MQRFFDKLVRYVRAVEVTGVDVGNTESLTTSRRTAIAPS